MYKDLKTIKKHTRLLDIYFLNKYSAAPYRACEHSCKYCDGRAERYFVEGDFEKDIVIRQNLPALLKEQIPKFKEKGYFSLSSGVTDAYQPVEKEAFITQKCGEELLKSNLAVSIHTKSTLLNRDLNLWKEVNNKNGFHLNVTILSLDDKIRNIFEPNASPINERLEMIKKVKEFGGTIGVFIMPILPFLTDSKQGIYSLLKKLKEVEVDFVTPGLLTLRTGIQREVYLQVIEENYPQLLPKYNEIYPQSPHGSPERNFSKLIYFQFKEASQTIKIPQLMPHSAYKNKLALYDEIYILLKHLSYLYKDKNINISPLKISTQKYTNWLLTEKKYLNRRRNMNYRFLEEKLLNLIQQNLLIGIIDNEKLTNFIKEIAIDRKTFNYNSLNME